VHLLGAVFGILSAATFALTNATGRRGVITGTPVQGMVLSLPIGLLCFLAVALVTGAYQSFWRMDAVALACLSTAGIIHFVIGRYCNFRASQAAGANLSAPVIQLNSVVTLVLAVIVLREPCTILQVIGGVLMLAGSLVTQQGKSGGTPVFTPRIATGFFFAFLAALMYGTSPIFVRQAIRDGGPLSGVAGGVIAYAAATVLATLGLLIPSLRRNVAKVSRDNARWFVYSGVFVAAAQGFLYSALAVAPILLVAPLLQLSLAFRFIFALLLNPHHELFGLTVVLGTVVSILGAFAVSMDTNLILSAVPLPQALAVLLRTRL
jgi:drug/metabolite transporter (DMT)-like permease